MTLTAKSLALQYIFFGSLIIHDPMRIINLPYHTYALSLSNVSHCLHWQLPTSSA